MVKINNFISFNGANEGVVKSKVQPEKDLGDGQKIEGKKVDLLENPESGKKISRQLEDYIRRIEDRKTFLEMLESNRENLNKDDGMDIKIKCLKIYLRMIRGDKVPEKDKKFLMEHEPELYSNAILFKKRNDNPKKHKPLVKDDKDNCRIEATKDGMQEVGTKHLIEDY